MEARFSTFVNWYVVALFLVQIVGWVGLVATFDHSPGPVVGWVLSFGGFPLESIPPLLITQGDVLVFASAYAVAVGGACVATRITGTEYSDDTVVP